MLHLRIAVVFQPQWMARSDSIRAMYFSVITFLNRRKEAEVKAESLSHQATKLNYQELGSQDVDVIKTREKRVLRLSLSVIDFYILSNSRWRIDCSTPKTSRHIEIR